MGRPRDQAIDDAVLSVTLQHLARDGYAALSLSAVATDAGTTRPALYRRWSGKEELVVAALATVAATSAGESYEDPFEALVSELASFAGAITSAKSLSVVGVMLSGSVPQPVLQRYRDLIVAPRRSRLTTCLERAVADGSLPPDADVPLVVTMLTGSWYGYALAGRRPPPDWPRRVAAAAWAACGAPRPQSQ